jgi:hypothetical protein
MHSKPAAQFFLSPNLHAVPLRTILDRIGVAAATDFVGVAARVPALVAVLPGTHTNDDDTIQPLEQMI